MLKNLYKIVLGILVAVVFLVPSKAQAAEAPKLNIKNKAIWVGDPMFDIEVLNINPADYKIVFSIKDPAMARINKTTGRVKALSSGKTSQTVVYCRLTNLKTREITNLSTILYVKEKASAVEITNKELANEKFPINGTIDLDSVMYNRAGIATDVRTEYVTDYRVWYSEDPDIAVVDPETGVVTGLSRGTATIWVQTYTSKTLTGVPTAEDYVTVTVSATTATPTPKPTLTSKPTPTSKPTQKPVMTSTPKPSITPVITSAVSATPKPTTMPATSVSPIPTTAPGVSSTPQPSGTPAMPVMLSAVQKSLNEVKVTFSEDVSKTITKGSFVVTDTQLKSKQFIHKVYFSEDGKEAIIKFYSNLRVSTIFTVQYNDKTATFKSSDGKVAGIELKGGEVEYQKATPLNLKLVDINGVDVTTKDNLQNVSFNYTNGYVDTFNNMITLFQVGDVASVTATYYTYTYDTIGNQTTYTASAVYRAVEQAPVILTELFASVGKKDNGAKWNEKETFIALGDDDCYLYAKAVYDDGTEKRTVFAQGDLEFISTMPEALLIDKTGKLIPIRTGIVEVLVSDGGQIIGSTSVNIAAERYPVSVRPSGVSARLSAKLKEDTATFEFVAYDQYGDVLEANMPLSVVPITGRGNDVVEIPASAISNNSFTVSGDMYKTAGVYQYAVTYMSRSFTINIQIVTPGTPVSYRVVVENDGCDVKVTDETPEELMVTIKLFAYDASGYKAEFINKNSTYGPNNYKFGYTITKLGEAESEVATPITGVIGFAARYIMGNTIEQATAGTYRVTIYASPDGTQKTNQVAITTFNIINTQKQPVLEQCANTIKQYPVNSDILRCFTVNGELVEEGDFRYYIEAVTEEVGSYLWVKSITLYENYGGYTLAHQMDNINVTFKME